MIYSEHTQAAATGGPYAPFHSDYFSGLASGKRAQIISNGPIRGSIRPFLASGQKLAYHGTLTDHCLAATPNDRTLLFSALLTDDLVLQALATRSAGTELEVASPEVRAFYDKNPTLRRPEDFLVYPIQRLELRTITLVNATIRDSRSVEVPGGPSDVWFDAEFLGDSGLLMVAVIVTDSVRAVIPATVSKEGDIPYMRALRCSSDRKISEGEGPSVFRVSFDGHADCTLVLDANLRPAPAP